MLGITIFSCGSGESILVKLPNGKYGVVDCHSTSCKDNQNNLLCQYLSSMGIKELFFLCWTHPHADHSYGLPYLLDIYGKKIEFVWRFGSRSSRELCKYIQAYIDKHKTSGIDTINQIIGDNHYTIDIFSKIYNNIHKDKILQIKAAERLYKDDKYDLEIIGLSPYISIKEKYDEVILDLALNANKKAKDITERELHNNISSAIAIKYGKARIILGADTLSNNWKLFLKDSRLDDVKCNLDFIKIPHHGSSGAFEKKLWKIWGNRKKLIGVITSLKKNHLPKKEMIVSFSQYCKCIVLGKAFKYKKLPNQALLDYLDASSSFPLRACHETSHAVSQ